MVAFCVMGAFHVVQCCQTRKLQEDQKGDTRL